MIGKSMLIKMLTLFEPPSEGEILFNGVSAKKYDARILRANMSVLFQDFGNISCHTLYYDLSVLDNIGISSSKEDIERDCVIEAAKQCGIHDQIRAFGSFYNTKLEKEWDNKQSIYFE